MPLFAIPYPVLNPIALQLGPFAVRWYALAYIAGLVLGWLYGKRLIATPGIWTRQPGDPALFDDLLVWVALGVILGGRLVYVIFYNPVYYWENPADIVQLWHGGMAFHGGLIGATLAIVLFARRHAIPVLSYCDVVAAVAPIGLFFGRLANFINGELYGRVSDVPWAMVFPNGGPDPRHPSQLYEAGLEGFVLFAILQVMVRRGALHRPGLVAGTFALGYGIARILVETVREPDVQVGYFLGFVTMGMILSLPLVLGGLGLVVYALRRRPGVPEAR